MNRKTLWLSTSALVGAAMITAPSFAGSVGSRGTMSISLGGELRFNVGMIDQDITANNGRGYTFLVDESEIQIGAKATAENGIEYGVGIELNAGAGDGASADEAYAFISNKAWGKIEMGDQDDATDAAHVGAHGVLVGRGGADGDVADLFTFGGTAVSGPGVSATGDATKIRYTSPGINGFTFGASWTPDSGESSGGAATADSDADGDNENVLGLGISYSGEVANLGFDVSLIGEFGSSETAAGAEDGDIETIGVGINLTAGNLGFGFDYVNFAEQGITTANQAAGQDAGSYYQLGASYQTGPWGVSIGWFESTVSNATGSGGDTDARVVSLDTAYGVAPGWDLMASLHFASVDNMNSTATEVNNDGTAFIISNNFKF